MIRWFRRKNPARELALKGARIRKQEWTAKRNAKVAELCAGMGRPVPEALR